MKCDNGYPICDEVIYKIGDKKLCTDCAMLELIRGIQGYDRMLDFIQADRDREVEFFLNKELGCDVQEHQISDRALEIIRNYCLKWPNMIYDDMTKFVGKETEEFIEYCGGVRQDD